LNKIFLSEEGIFPITKESDGNLLKCKPATGLSFSGTIQGEGKLAGIPSLFVRLAGCNLSCIWKLPNGNLSKCDTYYACNRLKNREITIETTVKTIKQNLGLLKHIVITGGEPLLQKEAVDTLASTLKSETDTHLTLETNGTLFDEKVIKNFDLISISPKLKNSNPTKEQTESSSVNLSKLKQYNQKRINIDVLQSFIDMANKYDKDIQFKFVVASENEEDEIKKDFLGRLKNYTVSDIMIMPLGSTIQELEQTQYVAFKMAVKNGWRLSPRLHINLFNNVAGV